MPTTIAKLMVMTWPNQLTSFAVMERPRLRRSSSPMATIMLDVMHNRRRQVMAPRPIHPGGHLREELKLLGVSAAELARQLDVPTNRITAILNEQRGITADT